LTRPCCHRPPPHPLAPGSHGCFFVVCCVVKVGFLATQFKWFAPGASGRWTCPGAIAEPQQADIRIAIYVGIIVSAVCRVRVCMCVCECVVSLPFPRSIADGLVCTTVRSLLFVFSCCGWGVVWCRWAWHRCSFGTGGSRSPSHLQQLRLACVKPAPSSSRAWSGLWTTSLDPFEGSADGKQCPPAQGPSYVAS
jgi:hypothetical protein